MNRVSAENAETPGSPGVEEGEYREDLTDERGSEAGALTQRILIVDDEHAIRSAMKDYLESYDWEVECGRDVDEAKLLLSRSRFEVVIADLRLSPAQAIGGLDLVAHVRDQYPQTHTILLTAYGSSQVEQEARRIGVDAFLHKPQPLAEIVKIVYEVLG